jgi:hypothetical protein
MARHDTVILEEPPDPRLEAMLSGEMDIPAYLEPLDLEYPEFSRLMAEGLRKLHGAGRRILQIEPFLSHLIAIHEGFAGGGRPADLEAGTDRHRVYESERDATAALLAFYEASVRGGFDETVGAVQRFARADARRFELRDRMRADALAAAIAAPGRYCIEAGQMHYPLWRQLEARLPPSVHLRPRFLMAGVLREMGIRGRLFGPGDLLTLRYRFHPGRSGPEEDLLAARALVFNKLVAKEEIVDAAAPHPHLRDEAETDAVVRRLSLSDCARLFPRIRRAPTEAARREVARYLATRNPSA